MIAMGGGVRRDSGMGKRSRAYPVLSLEQARRLMQEILAGLGEGAFSREVLGEALGYSNAHGGPGARKIAALVQYGLLRRKAGLYSPTVLARRVVSASPEATLPRALRQPQLFAALLDRYTPQGRVPSQLDGVLWRDYGITRKASRGAAETFCQSARFAGVMDRDGVLLPAASEIEAGDRASHPAVDRAWGGQPKAGGPATEQRFELALTGGRVARLFLPLDLCRRDLDIVRRQLEFLEYQVIEEEA
jgi:hypothetical protein